MRLISNAHGDTRTMAVIILGDVGDTKSDTSQHLGEIFRGQAQPEYAVHQPHPNRLERIVEYPFLAELCAPLVPSDQMLSHPSSFAIRVDFYGMLDDCELKAATLLLDFATCAVATARRSGVHHDLTPRDWSHGVYRVSQKYSPGDVTFSVYSHDPLPGNTQFLLSISGASSEVTVSAGDNRDPIQRAPLQTWVAQAVSTERDTNRLLAYIGSNTTAAARMFARGQQATKLVDTIPWESNGFHSCVQYSCMGLIPGWVRHFTWTQSLLRGASSVACMSEIARAALCQVLSLSDESNLEFIRTEWYKKNHIGRLAVRWIHRIISLISVSMTYYADHTTCTSNGTWCATDWIRTALDGVFLWRVGKDCDGLTGASVQFFHSIKAIHRHPDSLVCSIAQSPGDSILGVAWWICQHLQYDIIICSTGSREAPACHVAGVLTDARIHAYHTARGKQLFRQTKDYGWITGDPLAAEKWTNIANNVEPHSSKFCPVKASSNNKIIPAELCENTTAVSIDYILDLPDDASDPSTETTPSTFVSRVSQEWENKMGEQTGALCATNWPRGDAKGDVVFDVPARPPDTDARIPLPQTDASAYLSVHMAYSPTGPVDPAVRCGEFAVVSSGPAANNKRFGKAVSLRSFLECHSGHCDNQHSSMIPIRIQVQPDLVHEDVCDMVTLLRHEVAFPGFVHRTDGKHAPDVVPTASFRKQASSPTVCVQKSQWQNTCSALDDQSTKYEFRELELFDGFVVVIAKLLGT